MDKYKELCELVVKTIETHETYTRLMGSNDDPTLDDGINLLTLVSVIHDDLKGELE